MNETFEVLAMELARSVFHGLGHCRCVSLMPMNRPCDFCKAERLMALWYGRKKARPCCHDPRCPTSEPPYHVEDSRWPPQHWPEVTREDRSRAMRELIEMYQKMLENGTIRS